MYISLRRFLILIAGVLGTVGMLVILCLCVLPVEAEDGHRVVFESTLKAEDVLSFMEYNDVRGVLPVAGSGRFNVDLQFLLNEEPVEEDEVIEESVLSTESVIEEEPIEEESIEEIPAVKEESKKEEPKKEEQIVEIVSEEPEAIQEDVFEQDEQTVTEEQIMAENEPEQAITEPEESVVEDVVYAYLPEIQEYLYANSSGEMTEDFLSLCSVIHHEAGPQAPLESKVTVGHVIMNRLKNFDVWQSYTISDVLYRPRQFAVVKMDCFEKTKTRIRDGDIDPDLQNSIDAAYMVITGSSQYDIPDDVCYFYGDPDRRVWGKHIYCFTLYGNSYFK